MESTDILIAGAGPVGLALALALQSAERHLTLADARAPGEAAKDPRTLALSWGTRLTLERLGVWSDLRATPIETIHVSQRGGFGRTVVRADEEDVAALGYVVTAGDLAAALASRLDPRVRILHHTEVRRAQPNPHRSPVADTVTANLVSTLGDGLETTLTARLLVCAEGGLDGDDPSVVEHDYKQIALIGFVDAPAGHRHTAYERFTADGPIALLPCEHRYALVHVVPPARAASLLQLDASAYLAELQSAFGRRVMLSGVSDRLSYPLKLRYRRNPVDARTVWLGNAAQTLHPVAGQGFNLALRDLWALANRLDQSDDPGATVLLHAYRDERRLDRASTIGFTDALVRLFSNDLGPLRQLRAAGLLALDLIPPARHFIARRMMFGARAWP